MATHVKVVLTEDIDNLGKTGELVRVKPGYARNFLIPRGLAALATRGNIEQVEHERRTAVARADKARVAATAEAETLHGVVVEIAKQAGEEGKLYGSVTAQDVADALAGSGFTIDRRKIEMPAEPVRQLGRHEIAVRFGAGVLATVVVDVIGQT